MIRDKLTDDRGQVGIGTLIVFIALVLVAAIAAGVLINTAGFLQTQAEETGQDSTEQVADNINVIGEVGEVAEFDDGGGVTENGIYQTRLTVQRSPGSSDIDLGGLSIQYVGDNGFENLVHVSEIDDDGTDIFANDGTDTAHVDSQEDPTDSTEITNRGTAGYLVEEITAESDGDAVLTDDGDRYEIVIPLATALALDTDTETHIVINDPEIVDGNLDGGSVDPTAATIRDDYNDVEADDTDVVLDNMDLLLLEEGERAELEITTVGGANRLVTISAPDTLIDEEGGTVTL